MLSGGLDSAVALAAAAADYQPLMALTFDYGQRCAADEIAAAGSQARHFRAGHQVVPLPFLRDWSSASSLVGRETELAEGSESLAGRRNLEDPASVWIPNRNGLFINTAASLAEARRMAVVVIGINAEEGRDFPDNTLEYLERATGALALSTLTRVAVVSPTGSLTKRGIVQLGARLGVDFSSIYSCYRGGHPMCGRCESCLRTRQALEQEGYKTLVKKIFAV